VIRDHFASILVALLWAAAILLSITAVVMTAADDHPGPWHGLVGIAAATAVICACIVSTRGPRLRRGDMVIRSEDYIGPEDYRRSERIYCEVAAEHGGGEAPEEERALRLA
jgi:hypothetical protein